MLPRERKIANCFEVPEATRSDRGPARQPAADEHELSRERATLACRGMARPQNRCHRVCKQPKPARSKAASAMTESHHSDHCRLRVRHSQPDTTTLLVSKLPATRSLQQPSAVSQKTEIQRVRRNLQANSCHFFRRGLVSFPVRTSFFPPEVRLRISREVTVRFCHRECLDELLVI